MKTAIDRLKELRQSSVATGSKTKSLTIPKQKEASPELLSRMNQILSKTFALYFSAHSIHWNVTGINFAALHSYFGDLYEDLHSAVDPIAEHIRALGAMAPTSLLEMVPADESEPILSVDGDLNYDQIFKLCMANGSLIELLRESITVAGASNEPGVQNFLQDRLDYHQKLNWQLDMLIAR